MIIASASLLRDLKTLPKVHFHLFGSPGGHQPHRVDGGDGLVKEQRLLDVLQGEEEVLQQEVVLHLVPDEGLLQPGQQLVVHGQEPAWR